jgi:hypothetical protein
MLKEERRKDEVRIRISFKGAGEADVKGCQWALPEVLVK